jgi:uncharacterized protein YqjF (DUF2071 family)
MTAQAVAKHQGRPFGDLDTDPLGAWLNTRGLGLPWLAAELRRGPQGIAISESYLKKMRSGARVTSDRVLGAVKTLTGLDLATLRIGSVPGR